MVAAAAAVVGEEDFRLRDPCLQLKSAAAAAAQQPRLVALVDAIPLGSRLTALSSAECLLARMDPHWAWELILSRLGRDAAFSSAVLGLDVAAQVNAAEARCLFAEKSAANQLFGRQLRADIAGRELDGLTGASDLPPARDLFPSEAAAWLAGTARRDPLRALAFADEVLEVHSPAKLQDAIQLLAHAVVAQGYADRIAGLARRQGYIAEQAAWTCAAALSGALAGGELAEHVADLRPRVVDELDRGDVRLAALPLSVALAAGDLAAMIPGTASAWDVSATDLAQAVFHTNFFPDTALHALQRIVALPELSPCKVTLACCSGEASGPSLAEACADVICLAMFLPWQPLPGTLGAILRWAPAGRLGEVGRSSP